MTLTREFEINDDHLAEEIIENVLAEEVLMCHTDSNYYLDWGDLSKEERTATAKAVFAKVLEKIEKGW